MDAVFWLIADDDLGVKSLIVKLFNYNLNLVCISIFGWLECFINVYVLCCYSG